MLYCKPMPSMYNIILLPNEFIFCLYPFKRKLHQKNLVVKKRPSS